MKFSQTILVALVAAMSTNNALGIPPKQTPEECWDENEDNYTTCSKAIIPDCMEEWCDINVNYQEYSDCIQCAIEECKDQRAQGREDCGFRRKLQEVQVSEIATHTCTSQNYELSVFVEAGHVVLTGEPKCDGSTRNSKCQECPALVFHTETTKVGNDEHLEKAIHEYQVNESEEKFGVGIFKLGELTEAYGGASAGTSMKYSLLKNNCASFLIEVLQKLGVKPTNRKLIKYVSRKLTENKKIRPLIMRELSEHQEGLAMIHEHKEDSAVIENFVSNYIEDRVD